VALSHDPNLRFATAREFAQAMRSGLERRETEFVTTVLSDPAAATRLMSARGRANPAKPKRASTAARKPLPPRQDPAVPDAGATAVTRIEPAAAPRSPAPAAKKSSGRGTRWLVALLLSAAIAGAAIAGFSLGQSSSAPVVNDTVQSQIDGMRGFIQNHR
jgi:uncharacterized protein HemX